LGRGAKITVIFCQDYTKDASIKPTKEFESKGKNTMEYRLDKITKG
jgi:hypothetical protein